MEGLARSGFLLFLKATVRHLNLFLKVDASTRAILAII